MNPSFKKLKETKKKLKKNIFEKDSHIGIKVLTNKRRIIN